MAQAGAEAQTQIAAAEKTVTDAQTEAQVELDRLASDYDVRTEAEIRRRDQALEQERLKGYEALRDLQIKQQAELSRLHREGERALSDMKEYYDGATAQTEHDGEQNLKQTRQRIGEITKSEQDSAAMDVELARHDHAERLNRIQTSNDEQERQFFESNQAQLERNRTTGSLAMQKSAASQNEKMAQIRQQTDEELSTLAQSSNRELRAMREDTALKLDAYASRNRDPFYRMVDTGAEISESSDGYELRARIPPHEREHLSVSVSGNELILSGYRRNEEKLEIEPGRSQSTSGFQSFRETFPMALPVDARRLSREFDGDDLVVRVPKTGRSYEPKPKPPVPARARLERPEFPKNLPIEPAKDPDEDPRIAEARARARPKAPPLG